MCQCISIRICATLHNAILLSKNEGNDGKIWTLTSHLHQNVPSNLDMIDCEEFRCQFQPIVYTSQFSPICYYACALVNYVVYLEAHWAILWSRLTPWRSDGQQRNQGDPVKMAGTRSPNDLESRSLVGKITSLHFFLIQRIQYHVWVDKPSIRVTLSFVSEGQSTIRLVA